MTPEQAATKWGMDARSVKKAIKEDRIRHFEDQRGSIVIPDDEIMPLPKSSIQSFLWVVLAAKNDPSWHPDISMVPDVKRGQLRSIFLQLEYRQYLDHLEDRDEPNKMFEQCRITSKGLSLVRSDRLPGSRFPKSIIDEGIPALFRLLIELLPRLVGAGS